VTKALRKGCCWHLAAEQGCPHSRRVLEGKRTSRSGHKRTTSENGLHGYGRGNTCSKSAADGGTLSLDPNLFLWALQRSGAVCRRFMPSSMRTSRATR
jgi:hypothetical protein